MLKNAAGEPPSEDQRAKSARLTGTTAFEWHPVSLRVPRLVTVGGRACAGQGAGGNLCTVCSVESLVESQFWGSRTLNAVAWAQSQPGDTPTPQKRK